MRAAVRQFWAKQLVERFPSERPRVGLAWWSGVRVGQVIAEAMQRRKSLATSDIEPLLDLRWINFVSLQKDRRWLSGEQQAPWYRSAKIYQQSRPLHWADVIDQVRVNLQMVCMTEEKEPVRKRTRKALFILAATDHGTMIVNRLDWIPDRPGYAVGVGCDLLENSVYERPEIDLTVGLVILRREYYGNGVIAIDGGANVGVHTIEMAKALYPYEGQVIAFEPQERIYYALCGNIVLNNCHNAFALQVALGEKDDTVSIPVPSYTKPGSYGGLEVRPPPQTGMVGTGQEPYKQFAPCRMMALDSLDIPRCDFIKLDLEGMEVDALRGGENMIQ